MKKRKLKLLALPLAVASASVIGMVSGTLAYFNSSAIFENQFNLGNYNVVTQEVFTSPSNWSPGDTTPKTITATNNGAINAAVRVKIEEAWTDSNGDEISNIPNDAVTLNFTTPSRWTYDSSDGYYYYNYYLKSGEATTSLIDSVTLNSNLNEANCVEENGVQTCTSDIQGLAGATYTLTFTIETCQYDKYQEVWDTEQVIGEKTLVEIMTANRTKDTLQVGDEICINGDTTECFNFYGYDGNNIKLLAKYNLKVGNITNTRFNYISSYSSSDSGYGLQSSEARGMVYEDGVTTWYGNVYFSITDYWDNYVSSYPADVYDSTNYIGEPEPNAYGRPTNQDYSIAYYVEEYKDKLEDYGVTISSARLLTYAEATDSSIGCDGSYGTCPTTGNSAFITNTTFWLGTVISDFNKICISSMGDLFGITDTAAGVRPVIVISKSDI